MAEPTEGMKGFTSTKHVLAGQITAVMLNGCYVQQGDEQVLRYLTHSMREHYKPAIGDWWLAYPDGYQAICPAHVFARDYVADDTVTVGDTSQAAETGSEPLTLSPENAKAGEVTQPSASATVSPQSVVRDGADPEASLA